MAPPQLHKRALPAGPPDVGKRVSKPTPTTSRTNGDSITNVRLSLYTSDTLREGIAFEKTCCAAQFSEIERVQVVFMEVEDKISTKEENEFHFDKELPPLIEISNTTSNIAN